MDVAILNFDANGLVSFASENTFGIFCKSELVGRHWTVILDSIQTADRAPLIRAMRATQAVGHIAGTSFEGFCITVGMECRASWTIRRLEGVGAQHQIALILYESENDGKLRVTANSFASYKDIFDNAVEGIFRTTLDGRYIEVNPALARLYGYDSPESLISATSDVSTQLYVEPDRRSEFVKLIQTEGYVAAFESNVYRADGSTIWISEYARTVCDDMGVPQYYEGSVVDITFKKRAEEALRQSEKKFRMLVESANVLPWEADCETWQFTYVGPQAVDFLGFPQEDWLRAGFWERQVHDEDRGWVTTVRAEAIKNRKGFECEYRMLSSKGQIIWVREVVSVIESSGGGQILGGFTFDITYRRFTEEAIRKGPQFVEHLVSSAPNILYLYDLPTKECLFITGRVDRILGYSQRALWDMKPLFIMALSHDSELADHSEYWESAAKMNVGQVLEREFRLRGVDGNWVWLRSRETVYIRDRVGRPQQIVGVASEITSQRLAYEELATNEALFRSLAETTKVIPFEMNLDTGRFTYVGPQAESLLGYPAQHWFRKDGWRSLIHPEDGDIAMQFMYPPQTHPGPEADFEAEFRLRTADGRVLWVHELVRYARGEDERLRALGFLFDITEAKTNEEQLRHTRDRLRALALRNQNVREDERTKVAREIHDELGQALSLFRIDVSWLESRLARVVSSETGALVEKTNQMTKMLDGTLHTVRRIISNLRPAVLDELGLKAAIEWQAEEFSRRAGIRCLVRSDMIEDVSDNTAIAVFRIFQEVLTNVLRHAHASRVDVELICDLPNIRLAIRDNGRGFSMEDTGRTKSFGLLGMRERAQALGGSFEIDSQIGNGTRVTVHLPAHVEEALPVPQERSVLSKDPLESPDEQKTSDSESESVSLNTD